MDDAGTGLLAAALPSQRLPQVLRTNGWVNPDLWCLPHLLCTPQGPTHPLGLLREGVWLPCTCLCIPRALLHLHRWRLLLRTPSQPCPPAGRGPCRCPSYPRCSRLPPVPRSPSLLPSSHQHPTFPTSAPLSLPAPSVSCCAPGSPVPRLPYPHPLAVPGSPCQRPPCAPGPAGAGAAGRALSPAEKPPNLPFQSAVLGTHARKANTDGKPRPDAAAPPAQHRSEGKSSAWVAEAAFPQLGINPHLEER